MKFSLPLLMLLVAITQTSVCACNIPVFRYALERWQPDACDVIVFHDENLTPQQLEIVQQWETSSAEQNGSANMNVVRHLVSSDTKATQSQSEYVSLLASLRQLGPVEFPYVAVQTKLGRGPAMNHWHGTLDQAVQASLAQSPVRQELSRRLLAGDSVVWLVLTSTSKKRTRDAEDLLERSFASIADRISLPEGIGLPGSELHSEVPLLLKYSTITLDANDEKEQFLVRLLTGLRPEAVEAGQPLLVPVFGRGRILEVIPADEVDPRLIEDLTRFLCGACSCQVKEQNPGFDLLMKVDWDTALFGEGGQRPPIAKSSRNRSDSPVLLTIPPGRKKK